MKKHIKKAAVSELPVLLKGIAIIIFTLFSYFAGIVFADYATGRELNYFEDINNYVEEKLAEINPSSTPVPRVTPTATAKPDFRPTKTPEPPKFRTTTLNKQSYSLQIEEEINESSSSANILLKNDQLILSNISLDTTNSNVNNFLYDESTDSLFYVIYIYSESGSKLEIKQISNFVYHNDQKPRQFVTLDTTDVPHPPQIGIKILNYETTTGSLILSSGFSDGCGGSGSVYKLKNSEEETILNYKRGCTATDGDNVFAGVWQDKVLFYVENGRWPEGKPDDLVSIDIVSLEKSIYLPSSYFPEDTVSIGQSIEDHTKLLFTLNESYSEEYVEYSLETRQFIETQ